MGTGEDATGVNLWRVDFVDFPQNQTYTKKITECDKDNAMPITYFATLKDNQLEWLGESPPQLDQLQPLSVSVTIVESILEVNNLAGCRSEELFTFCLNLS